MRLVYCYVPVGGVFGHAASGTLSRLAWVLAVMVVLCLDSPSVLDVAWAPGSLVDAACGGHFAAVGAVTLRLV